MNFPLFLLIAIIPSVVCLKYMQVPQDFTLLPGYEWDYDIFTWWKMLVLLSLATLSVAFISVRNYVNFSVRLAVNLFALLTFTSAMFSEFPVLAMFGMPQYCEGALAFIGYSLVFIVSTQINPKWVKPTLLLSTAGVFFFCLLQIIEGHTWLNFFMGREISAEAWPLYATLQNPNHLGLFLSLIFPFLLASDFKNQWIWGGVVSSAIVMIVGSASRLALVSCGLTTSFIIGHTKKLFLVIPLAAILIGATFSHSYHNVYKDRIYIWKNAIPLLKHTILLGHGPATFINEFPQTAPDYEKYQGDRLVDRPHNIYLQIAHGTGILSLLILGFIVVLSLVQPAPFEFKVAIFGFLIAGLFTDSFIGVTPLFCFLLGACWAREKNYD